MMTLQYRKRSEGRYQMKIIIKEPHSMPYYADVENELHALQKIVGGKIEAVTISDTVLAICNEEGKLLGLPRNCFLIAPRFSGFIEGTFFFCGVDGENFADVPDWFDISMAKAVTCCWMEGVVPA